MVDFYLVPQGTVYVIIYDNETSFECKLILLLCAIRYQL